MEKKQEQVGFSTIAIRQIASKTLKLGELIGHGNYGDVYKGTWHGEAVAIKQLYLKSLSDSLIEDFMYEAQIMSQCQFPQIVRLYGICVEAGHYAMVMEYMPKGSLYYILHEVNEPLPWNPIRWNIAVDIGKGLSCLHAQNIVHSDLKSSNVLLDNNYHAKICDFGLSKIKLESISSASVYKDRIGTARWAAPELFSLQQGKSTTANQASDVYSYGVILWEIASWKLPYKDTDEVAASFLIAQGKKEKIPEECPITYANIIQNCWAAVRERYTAEAALSALLKSQPKEAMFPLFNPTKPYEARSWHIDPETENSAVFVDKPYRLIIASPKDIAKVVEIYEKCPIPGFEIERVEAICNPKMTAKFALYLDELQNRNGSPHFAPTWMEEKDSAKKSWRSTIHRYFMSLSEPFKDEDYPAVKLQFFWHGTNSAALDSIFKAGYANLAKTDSGFFGKGLYFARELEYVKRVYSSGALVLNCVAVFSEYPVMDGDMEKLTGKNNYGNYDAHFIPVVPENPANPNEINYYPTKPKQALKYTELVVFQTAACLPRYLVTLQPTLVKSPAISPTDTLKSHAKSLFAKEPGKTGKGLAILLAKPSVKSSVNSDKKVIELSLPAQTFSQLSSSQLTSLFPVDFHYLEVFRGYQKKILAFITQGDPSTASGFFNALVLPCKTLLDKAVLLEAVEYVSLKLKLLDDSIRNLRMLITISQGAKALGMSPKQWDETILNLLDFYQKYLREEIDNCQDFQAKNVLQQENDLCLVLVTGIKTQGQESLLFEEKGFFKKLNERFVYKTTNIALYDPTLSFLKNFKNPSLERLWQETYVSITTRLNVSDLQNEKQAVENKRKEQKSCYHALIEAFKKYLSLAAQQRWKQQWLYQQTLPNNRFGGKAGVTVKGFFHISRQVTPGRFEICEDILNDLSGLIGSTYFSIDKPLKEEETLCMDANYQSGDAGATADGYGHFALQSLNRQVQQMAYRTVKLAVRYANLYTDAQQFYEDIPALFSHLGKAIKYSFLHPEEAGMASCMVTKTFATSNDNEKTIVAAGVGDGLAMVWSPEIRQLTVLVRPRQYCRGAIFTPMSITETLKGKMLDRTMKKVPSNSLLMRMTDGAWELLNHKRSEKLFDQGANTYYFKYAFNISALKRDFIAFAKENPTASSKEYREFLQQILQKSLETKKDILLKSQHQIKMQLNQYQNQDATVKAFLDLAAEENPYFYKSFLEFLEIVGWVLEDIEKATILDFSNELDKVKLGDDITLHVQNIGGKQSSLSYRL